MADDRDKRRNYRTPLGVPEHVSQEDERSVPVLVDTPAMSRTKTDSTPPMMTAQELVRDMTLRRKRIERDLEHTIGRVDALSNRIAELQEARAVSDVHLATVRLSLGEFETIAEFRELVVTRLTDVTGKDGTNGKLGALRARFDLSEARRWWMVTFCLGLASAAGAVVFWAGSTVAALRSDQANMKDQMFEMREWHRDHDRLQPRAPSP